MTIDWTKPIETLNGSNARVLSDDLSLDEGRAVVLAVANGVDESVVIVWPDGTTTDKHKSPYVRNKANRGWVNIYPWSGNDMAAVVTNAFLTREEADDVAKGDRIACVMIEWEEAP